MQILGQNTELTETTNMNKYKVLQAKWTDMNKYEVLQAKWTII